MGDNYRRKHRGSIVTIVNNFDHYVALAAKIIAITACILSCGQQPIGDDNADEKQSIGDVSALEQQQALEVLYDYNLPAGNNGSINIGWWHNGASTNLDPNQWLSGGFDGVRFRGQGVDVSHLRCDSWDGITLAVKQHNGVVELRDLTLHTGYNQATAFGEQNLAKKISPKFLLRLVNVKVVADVINGQRPKWLVFGYQADLHMQNVTIIGKEAVEHGTYLHGFAHYGALLQGVRYKSCGAECFKVRSDSTETAWVGPQAKIIIQGSVFKDWFQPWSWRGGAAVVLQGAAADITIDGALFKPGPGHAVANGFQRSKAIMISSEGSSYDIDTGSQSTGHGNGNVVVRNVYASGNAGPSWYSPIIRVGRNGGNQFAGKSFGVSDSGAWGDHLSLQVGQVDGWGLSGNNTQAIKDKAQIFGLDTTFEASYIEGGVWPFSRDRSFGP